MTDALGDGLRSIGVFLPKLLLFLIILGVGYLIATLVAKAVSAVLERVGFDRAVERGGVKRALENSSYDASDVVGKIIFYAVLLFVLQLAFGVFPANPVSDLLQGIISFLPLLIVAIIIIVVAAAIAAAARELVVNSLGGLSYGRALGNGASAVILGLGIIAALNQINVATSITTPILITVLATLGGILVVGVGGGLIRPMNDRWESYLSRAEEEAPKVRESARQASSVRERAQQVRSESQGAPDPAEPRRSGASRAAVGGDREPDQYQPGRYLPEPGRDERYGQGSYDQGRPSPEAYPPGPGFPERQPSAYPAPAYGGDQPAGDPYPAQPDPGGPRPGGQYTGAAYSGAPYADNQYSGGQYTDNQYSGDQYSDSQYSGEQYSGEQYSGGQYSGDQYSGGQQWETQQVRAPEPEAAFGEPRYRDREPQYRDGAQGEGGGGYSEQDHRHDYSSPQSPDESRSIPEYREPTERSPRTEPDQTQQFRFTDDERGGSGRH